MHDDVVNWLVAHFLPFEAELRRMLRRVCTSAAEIDDLVQETYAKVLAMESVDHVLEPKGFIVRIARNLVADRMRRDAIVSIEAMANMEDLELDDHAPSAERIIAGRLELKWIIELIDQLPERCRKVVRARRLHGLSLADTADVLGITVPLVNYETTRGMDLLSDMVAGRSAGGGAQATARNKNKCSE